MRVPYSRLLSTARLPTTQKHPHLIPQCRHLRGELLYIRDLGRATGDPLWILVDRLRRPTQKLRLSEALFKNGVPFEELQSWRSAIMAMDIDQAMSIMAETKSLIAQPSTQILEGYDHMDELDHYDGEAPIYIRRVPPWLVVFVAAHKVRTPAQASGALLHLVFSQLPQVPPHIRPSILVIVALSLAKYSLLAPMRRLLNLFLTIPVDHPALHFNLLLQAIARLPKSIEAADLAVVVLETMTSRDILLNSRTYRILLADRFVTLQLTKILQAKMVQQKFKPNAGHLESFARVFSKNGAIHDTQKYLEAVRLYTRRGNGAVPTDDDDGACASHTVNPHYIRLFGHDTISAFEYLDRLAAQRPNSKTVVETSTWPSRRHRGKSSVNVYDWTAAFATAARRWKTSSKDLIRLFDEMFKITLFRPTVVSYTVLLRGLIMRRSYDEAAHVWDRLIAERLILDRKALGAGVKALTLANQPLKAFNVLETFCATPPSSSTQVRQGSYSWRRRMNPSGRYVQRPVQVDTMTLNDFLVALLRIKRPDVVFKLWDQMETLYNVKPDSHSLDTLCRAARLAAKLDSQSLAGNIAMMGLSNPFHKPQVEPTTREEVVQTMEQMLDESGRQPARGIWKNAPAVNGVRNAVQQLIFGNWPDMKNIRSPAHAIRRPGSADTPFAPFREVAQSIARCLSSDSISEQRLREPPPHVAFSSPPRGSFIPTDAAFCQYILLLGTSSYQHEIPLVLAWMRALHVHPRRRTLCFSLIFWAEVSLRGPLFESWAEKNERSEYIRLHRWIASWVGKDSVPGDIMMADFLKIVAQARDPRGPMKRVAKYTEA